MTTTRMRAVLLVLVVLSMGVVLISTPVPAEAVSSFEVTSTGDTNDGVCNAHCTLREAITLANANGNPLEMDTITFNIPGAGPHMIAPATVLPLITQSLKIDGTTEPGTVCSYPNRALKIHLVGGPTNVNGLSSTSATVVVLGLSFTGFEGTAITASFGGGHEFRCNHIGIGPGGETADGNVVGMRFSSVTGANFGGPNAADRNVVSDNSTAMVVNNSSNFVINGNYFGTSVDGATAITNGTAIYGGGLTDTSILANVMVSTGAGVSLARDQSGLVIESNIINYAANGVTPIGPPVPTGILLSAFDDDVSTGHTIGGAAPGLGNRIRSSENGIQLYQDGTGILSNIEMRGNMIAMTAGRAIALIRSDLGTETIPNDNLDADTDGPNLFQNFPIVTSVIPGTGVGGSLNSTASSTFTIDIYANASCANKSAERYLGSVTGVSTDPSGNATFNATTLGAFNLGEGITATATDAAGNTSELSACLTAAGPVPVIMDISPEGVVAGASDTLVTVTGVNFAPDTKLLWNDAEQPTTYLNATTLQFTATAALIGNSWGGADIRIKDEDSQIGFVIYRSSSDIDCDGTADAEDALELMKVLAGYDSNVPCQFDANKSGGQANLADVIHILREIADLDAPLKSDVIIV